MEIDMGSRGELFVQFLKAKLRERKGSIDGYNDADFARELGIEYETVKRWLRSKSVKRMDLDNLLAVEDLFKDEFARFIRQEG